MIFYRFTLLIVDYGKKTDERCNYAYIYYSRTHIRRMHGAFYVFLLSEIQRRHNLHKTKKKTAVTEVCPRQRRNEYFFSFCVYLHFKARSEYVSPALVLRQRKQTLA